MNSRLLIALAILASFLGAPLARAVNITVSDKNSGSVVFSVLKTEQPSGWFKGTEGGFVGSTPARTDIESEFQEVEPGMQTGINWDLAAFIEPSWGTLGVLSGYDLATGGTTNTTLGDIFVAVDQMPTFLADPNTTYPQYTSNATFGYDFAIRLDFTLNQYSVIQLSPTTMIENGDYHSLNPLLAYNSASQPWRVALPSSGYTDLGTVIYTGAMTYTNSLPVATGQAISGLPVTSGYKYYAEVGTGWLASQPGVNPGDAVLYKLTMTCGNDNLVGLSRIPDNAITLSLVGLSLVAIGAFAKLQRRKAV